MSVVHFVRGPRGEMLTPLCDASEGGQGTTVRANATCWRCVHLLLGRPLPVEPKTPEHTRLAQAKKTEDATQLLSEFVMWLTGNKRLEIARWSAGALIPCGAPRLALVAEFFGVSEGALEAEKRAILDHVRAVSAAEEWADGEGRRALSAR